ncbi:MAG: type II CAAX endopeptidase family protein [Verrucomicrobia bacterium]|nr:type II CAAX endopeptidase family protein [Verrucomicrobiota bacterium]
MQNRTSAHLALLLLVPIPTIGVLFGMILAPDTPLGQAVFGASKLWILILPLIWTRWIEKRRWSWAKPDHGGFGIATLIGLAMALVIGGAYLAFADRLIDRDGMRVMAGNIGLDNPGVYLGAMAYWVLINAVLEEYVWRWFVVRQCEQILSRRLAIVLSALAFTLHHIVAMQVYFNWVVVTAAAIGIFIGGAAWSWCYLRFRSIWPGYISHAIVDIAVFGIGYQLIFGP